MGALLQKFYRTCLRPLVAWAAVARSGRARSGEARVRLVSGKDLDVRGRVRRAGRVAELSRVDLPLLDHHPRGRRGVRDDRGARGTAGAPSNKGNGFRLAAATHRTRRN